jgi:hypothetical protein
MAFFSNVIRRRRGDFPAFPQPKRPYMRTVPPARRGLGDFPTIKPPAPPKLPAAHPGAAAAATSRIATYV